jgi:hypothetical protein
MKELDLFREPSGETETMGVLSFDDVDLYTIEQEWRPTAPGGEPNNSCVPAGKYQLIPHTRPNGDEVVALINPGLGVYYEAADRPNGVGRYLILIHAGNYSTDIVGCIAPGLGRHDLMVTQSRDAMDFLLGYIGDDDAEITIHE